MASFYRSSVFSFYPIEILMGLITDAIVNDDYDEKLNKLIKCLELLGRDNESCFYGLIIGMGLFAFLLRSKPLFYVNYSLNL